MYPSPMCRPPPPHRLGPESRKTHPLPPIPRVLATQPQAVPPPSPRALVPLPLRGTAIRPQSPRSPPGRERAPARPPPRPPPRPDSGFTRGRPELLLVARAGSRRSRLAHPSLAPRGRRLGPRAARGYPSRFAASPSPLSPCRTPVHSSRGLLACLFWGWFCVGSFWTKT